jgi:hypothetical protein
MTLNYQRIMERCPKPKGTDDGSILSCDIFSLLDREFSQVVTRLLSSEKKRKKKKENVVVHKFMKLKGNCHIRVNLSPNFNIKLGHSIGLWLVHLK